MAQRPTSVPRATIRAAACALGLLGACKADLDLGHDDRAIAAVPGPILVTQKAATATTVPLHLTGYTSEDGVAITCTIAPPMGLHVGCSMADGSTSDGTLTLSATADVPPDDYTVVVAASVAATSASRAPVVEIVVPFTVAVGVAVSTTNDTSLGIGGRLDQFLSTAFQPADWQADIFAPQPGMPQPDMSAIQGLAPRHVLIQVMNGGAIPLYQIQGTNDLAWDFTKLDPIVQSILDLSATDPRPGAGPEMQLAVAPSVPQMIGSDGLVDPAAFATYAACLVGYYNKGSFQDPYSAQTIKNPRGARPIPWWGIWSDYNVSAGNGFPTMKYAQVYQAAATAMLAVDSTIQLSALEFNDYPGGTGHPQAMDEVPTFLTQIGSSVPVDAVSLHFYATDDPTTSDEDVFGAVVKFQGDVQALYQTLATGPLAQVPVWITQNNVNGDSPDAMGNSTSNGNRSFSDDLRGSDAFFAAWRPYVFSLAGKAGNRGIVHWQYASGSCQTVTTYCAQTRSADDTDKQNAEVDYATGRKYVSYWVDYELSHMFPSPPGQQILGTTISDTSPNAPNVEVLATTQDQGPTVVMVVNKAVSTSPSVPLADGPGQPITVVVDVSALVAGGVAAQQASVVTIDGATSTDTGPVPEARTLGAGFVPVTFAHGYGVAFLILDPSA